jgi:hypothetical protein
VDDSIPLRIGLVILTALTSFIFPPSFLLSIVIAAALSADVFGWKPQMPEGILNFERLTSADQDWLKHVRNRTESPFEVAFLDAMLTAFALVPDAASERPYHRTLPCRNGHFSRTGQYGSFGQRPRRGPERQSGSLLTLHPSAASENCRREHGRGCEPLRVEKSAQTGENP